MGKDNLYYSKTDFTEEKEYTIMAFTENNVGLLNEITIIMTRRKINIESLSTSASELPSVHKFTIVIKATRHVVEKVVKQIEKIIYVLKAIYYTNDEIVYQEMALYKVPTEVLTKDDRIETLIRKYNARILNVDPKYMVIEKTGYREETHNFFEALGKDIVLEFNRSGRIAISKRMKMLRDYIEEMEQLVG